MNTLLFILLTVISAEEALITSGEHNISITDMHVSLYDLETEQREKAFKDVKYLDVILRKLLNYEYAYDYVLQEGLNKSEDFVEAENLVSEFVATMDYPDYIKLLGMDEKLFKASYYDHRIRKEYFFLLEEHFKKTLDYAAIDKYIEEVYSTIKPSQDDLKIVYAQVVELPKDHYSQTQIIDSLKIQLNDDQVDLLLPNLQQGDTALNSNEVKLAKDSKFNLPFTNDIYNYENSGVIPKIFEFEGNYYVARINKIDTSGLEHYYQYKERVLFDLVDEQIKKRMQNVINTYSQSETKVNGEAIEKLLESYANL